MICGDRDQVGILTDIDPAIRHVPRRWRPQQRPQRSVNRLSRRLTVISRIAHGQVQEQHRARQFIDQYAGLSPDVAVALRTTARLQFAVSRWLAIDVIIIVIGPSDYLTPDRQYQGCRGLSAVERVGVAQHVGGQLRTSDAARGQALQYRFDTATELESRRWALSCKALEKPDARRSLKQSDQFAVSAAAQHIRPHRLQRKARRGEIRNRAIELFKCVAQRSGDAGILERGIDEANVDL